MHDTPEEMFLKALGQGTAQMSSDMLKGIIVQVFQEVYVRCENDEMFAVALENAFDGLSEVFDPATTNSPEDLASLVEEREKLNEERMQRLNFNAFAADADKELQILLDTHGVLEEEDDPGHGNYL